ncbi:sensor domain-containing diguanylate cyclase [Ruminococcus albus]|uniref:Diguanylate cyclase (GGDEF) domain-containing protein n=1 Tax=Ruminococcus albus TaxID=1264 RepID=A0A1H7KH03_RUMAL|nr:GGDEF domain-containing protein [Ruminococcus albus]SEK85790.1 diguanylate cyclase (GGDEF) domain-containing protein [Ruminococcus albus]
MDFQKVVDSISKAACVVSVETPADGSPMKFRIVTGNRAYLDTIERPMQNVEMLTRKFVPNSEYTNYLNRDLNFEDSCYCAAVEKKLLHAYAHPARYDVWFNMSFLPLSGDEGDLHYCMYIMEINFKPDAKRMSTISADIASAVLETCIKLRSADDFRSVLNEICEDIRDLCDSENCCVLLMDKAKRSCSVLCEAFSKDTKLVSMENYLTDDFYDIAESWENTIAGSNCLVVKNDSDMEVVRERNPVWHDSITSAGGKTIVLFPLEFKNELLGYIWAINFSADVADTIKETLELTTFILASEIYSFKMMDRLHVLSSKDMLTGVMNRNEMNNYVDDLVKGRSGRPIGVVFADLNGLKVVNDSQGHIAGDELLKKAASALQEVFSSRDIFRAGGDEFVVMLTGVTEEELYRKTEELRETAKKYTDLVFAIGYAYEESTAEVHKALRLADERMYLDKKHYYEMHPEKKRSSIAK